VKIKDSVHQMCAEPSTNAQTFSLLEEIGYAHLNDEKPETKFLLNTDHVVLAVRIILDSNQLEEPIEVAKQFVIALVDLKLAKLDDAWIRMIVRAELEKFVKAVCGF
jgi:hypothetical protein